MLDRAPGDFASLMKPCVRGSKHSSPRHAQLFPIWAMAALSDRLSRVAAGAWTCYHPSKPIQVSDVELIQYQYCRYILVLYPAFRRSSSASLAMVGGDAPGFVAREQLGRAGPGRNHARAVIESSYSLTWAVTRTLRPGTSSLSGFENPAHTVSMSVVRSISALSNSGTPECS